MDGWVGVIECVWMYEQENRRGEGKDKEGKHLIFWNPKYTGSF